VRKEVTHDFGFRFRNERTLFSSRDQGETLYAVRGAGANERDIYNTILMSLLQRTTIQWHMFKPPFEEENELGSPSEPGVI